MITAKSLPGYLSEWFPTKADDIARIRSECPDTEVINVYTYLSEVFRWEIFEPALRAVDEDVIGRCFAVTDATGIRITPHLLNEALMVVGQYAGAHLRADIRRESGE